MHNKKMDVPYLLKGCRKCPYTDKSRPYILWTLADLLLVYLFELPTFLSTQ